MEAVESRHEGVPSCHWKSSREVRADAGRVHVSERVRLMAHSF